MQLSLSTEGVRRAYTRSEIGFMKLFRMNELLNVPIPLANYLVALSICYLPEIGKSKDIGTFHRKR